MSPPRQKKRLAEVGELYDRYGAALFQLAHALTGTTEAAEAAVIAVLATASTGHLRPGHDHLAGHHLARLTFLACATAPAVPHVTTPGACAPAEAATPTSWLRGLDPQRRALLALTFYGDHTYAEAASLLGMGPDAAAHALQATLRERLC